MDIPFSVRVIFTGICGLVPDRPWDEDPEKVCVLLIDGRDPTLVERTPEGRITIPTETIENPRIREFIGRCQQEKDREYDINGVCLDNRKDLARHTGFVQFDTSDLAGDPALPADTQGVWRLNRQRLNFRIVQKRSEHSRLDVDYTRPAFATVTSTSDQGSLRWAPDMSSILPVGCAEVDPCSLAPSPPKAEELVDASGKMDQFPILAQIVLDTGHLRTYDLGVKSWTFASRDSVNEDKTIFDTVVPVQLLAHEVALEMKGLLSFSLVASAFDDPQNIQVLSFAPDANECPVDIRIANFCDENPLSWNRIGEEPDEDTDFKWHYEFLSKSCREKILPYLTDKTLPIPRLSSNSLNGAGDNCRKALFPDSDITRLPRSDVTLVED